MSFIRAEAVTGFTFGLVNKPSGAALTGAAAGVDKFISKDGDTQASIAGSIAEEGNGQYSVEIDADQVELAITHSTALLRYKAFRTV